MFPRFTAFVAIAFTWLCLPLQGEPQIVVIDPGHGGTKDSGSEKERSLSASNNAKTPAGLLEKDLTLELSLEIERQIQALAANHPGTTVQCVLTRREDLNPDFVMRAEVCASQPRPPAAIVSIHFNASADHRRRGTVAVIHNRKANPNHLRDEAFAKGLCAATSSGVDDFQPSSKPLPPIDDSHLHDGKGSNFFHQLASRPTLKNTPKCFLEVEFIDGKDVEEKLIAKRKESFPVIAKAIAEYLYAHCAAQGGGTPAAPEGGEVNPPPK